MNNARADHAVTIIAVESINPRNASVEISLRVFFFLCQ